MERMILQQTKRLRMSPTAPLRHFVFAAETIAFFRTGHRVFEYVISLVPRLSTVYARLCNES
eukprot:6179735-Pleurochrysis_carterae.AAC.2